MPHDHHTQRSGWLRAAVLGANDGIVSTASLLIGLVAAHAARENVVLAGIAALAAGTMAMAAGEYVSVGSQADIERADLALEREGLIANPEAERQELAAIYVGRGLTPNLAQEVASQLMARDALAAHARDEIGISDALRARPLQASFASGTSFAFGAAIPLLTLILAPPSAQVLPVAAIALACLALLGGLAAQAGGANIARGAARVLLWGALAMAVTATVGGLVQLLG
ncbi:MAG TPA: VIT1/CCC1 transporter family protein [Stellaceae bacterium]|jgi:VIT1/CCC1 family predicted Fe2+/Mn2+ transporter|nr:VIT1/CCC1 transporter family protein [Stellaceae bacterium]